MLDRRSTAQVSVPLSLAASGPVHTEVAEGRDPCRVAGEDAPVWLAASFAIIGTMIAVASATAWQQGGLGPTQPPELPAAALVVDPPRRNLDEWSASASPPVRDAVIPSQPQPASESPPPPAAAPAAAPAMIADAAPVAVTIGTATSQVPDRRTAAECFGPLTIPFARNSAQPNADDVRKSGEPLRRWLSAHGDAVILIEGHSDTTGTEDVNVLLSYSRAKAVASLLRRAGMPARQMTIRAAGSSEAAGGTTGLASDRSALLRIAGVEDCGGVETAAKGP